MHNSKFALSGVTAGIALTLASLCFGIARAQGTPAEQIWPTADWQTSTPEAQGMDSGALAKLVAFGKAKGLDSLLVVRHGRIVLDATYAPYNADIPHAINSGTKAVVGTLAAMLLKDGLLDSFDHPMLDFFRNRDVANLDARKKAITVQHLLDMTSGFDWEEGIDGGREQSLEDLAHSPDQIKFILDRPMAHAPGDIFYYNSGNPHLVSAIITRLTGTRAADYANARLFGPLGIAPPRWLQDPQGFSLGGGSIALRPRDAAKFGYLYLRHGEWAGQQLVPPAFVDAVNHASVDMHASWNPNLRYANFFWVMSDRHVYWAQGDHCQMIMIFPQSDIVTVVTAHDYCPFEKIADDIVGAVKLDAALPQNPDSADRLARAISDAATEKPAEVGTTPVTAAAISGKTYRFADNALNVTSLSLRLADSNPTFAVAIDTHSNYGVIQLEGPIGLDGRYRQSKPFLFGVPAAKGTWRDDRTFAIDVQLVGSGERRSWSVSFDGDRVTLHGNARDDGRDVSVEGTAGG